MGVALFSGTGVAKYRGAPKDKQSQQQPRQLGLVSLTGEMSCVAYPVQTGVWGAVNSVTWSRCQQAEPDFFKGKVGP